MELDAERVCDIALATNEAMANSADHAYRASDDSGPVLLVLSYDAIEATVTVRVIDEGQWLEPAATTVNSIRRRGLDLMEALSDACAVDGRADGTSVTLVFRDCPGYENLTSRLG